MPEGDTVWRTARRSTALCRAGADRTDFRVPALATADLAGRHGARDGLPRQAPAHPASSDDAHPAHPPEDGGLVAPLPPGHRWRRPAHEARVVLRTATRRRSASRSASTVVADAPTRTDARRPPRPGPARPRLGRRRGATPAAADPDAPDRRGAARPAQPRRASATCTRPSCCFLAGRRTRAPRSAPCPTCAGWSRGPSSCSRPTATAPTQATTGDLRRGSSSGSTAAAAAVPALRHPHRHADQGDGRRTGHLLVPALPAGRGRVTDAQEIGGRRRFAVIRRIRQDATRPSTVHRAQWPPAAGCVVLFNDHQQAPSCLGKTTSAAGPLPRKPAGDGDEIETSKRQP